MDRITVEKIAELAKLQLTDEELALYQEQLTNILDYVDNLNMLNTDDIPPTASVLNVQSVWREDTVRDTLPIDKALANAPDTEARQFRVDAVLDNE
jgi:aspartyl-tRNA(Asn)/glutamyl-tRNA(Gln) amidotransferase subunit C